MKYPRIVEGFLIRNSPTEGYGIFAQRDFKKGALLFCVCGNRLTDRDKRLSHRAIQVGTNRFVEPYRFSIVWYLNHSCEPNAHADMERFIARKDIRKGDEITADYSLFTDYPSWDMDCLCNMNSCRKVILPFSRLKPRPTEFVSSYLSGKTQAPRRGRKQSAASLPGR
jgi:SET domain-containing protein